MTDNSLFANPKKVSSSVLYDLKAMSVPCNEYRASIRATKSSYSPSDTITTYIPARRNCFLNCQNSYMRFTVANQDADVSFNVDGTAYSFFKDQTITHGSNVLETIGNMDVLASYLADFQMGYSDKYGFEATMGTTADRVGVEVGADLQRTFCVPILSGVVGALNPKFLPLGISDDIALQLTLNTGTLGAAWQAATTDYYTIIDFQLELSILQLGEEGMKMVESITPFSKPIFMNTETFRHVSPTLQASSSGNQTLALPFRLMSLKQLILCPRRSTEIASQTSYSISSRINPNFETVQFRMGSLMVPQYPITLKNANTTGAYGEGFMNTVVASNKLSTMTAPSIPFAQYNVADAADATCDVSQYSTTTSSYLNAFALAQEFESFANSSSVILNGSNTLNLNMYLETTSNTAIGATAYTIDSYAHADMLLKLDTTGLYSTIIGS